MLQITVPSYEGYDGTRNLFIETKEQTLVLEHSLVSISKWESKWHKPFLNNKDFNGSGESADPYLDYIKCMTITKNVPDEVYIAIAQSGEILKKIQDYIQDPMTATWFSNEEHHPNREVITSELIYYWMTVYAIPFECQKWHINRLLTLIHICAIKQEKQKKMSKGETAASNRSLNAARRAKMHSRG